ncbi:MITOCHONDRIAL GROUP I INTRON SPLICING FACTOR CCM1 [Salix viminalis]|uniref:MITOCHONDRIAL GROUP I INTRON SPLICING FACTOR CCM1 n=1 Tax=Salix viminalis TaxID=40686 RepID=A0A9Q0UI18_SALVM|nr:MITOCHONDRIAL GROUP I INTRON SPLICING FACTOR CCM1 [Salix viminalis]
MELPGFRCLPDIYTYTILISSCCRYGLQTGCRKAIRRRIWEANRLFKIMLFKGFVPDVVTYNCLINGCCKTNKIERALELFEEMINKRGCVPNRVTYNSFIRYFSVVNEIDKAVEMLRKMQNINHGLATTSSCTPIIHSLCEAGRVPGARDFLVELVDGGLIPREYTCRLVCDALKSKREGSSLGGEFDKRIKDGIEDRYREVKNVKPIMAYTGYLLCFMNFFANFWCYHLCLRDFLLFKVSGTHILICINHWMLLLQDELKGLAHRAA